MKTDKLQFILKIDLGGNMEMPSDVACVLHSVIRQLEAMDSFDGDSCGIRDLSGNRVGNWRHDYAEPRRWKVSYYAVRKRGTDKYLTMSKFAPGTTIPRVGPETQAWIADSFEAAWIQAWLLDKHQGCIQDHEWEAVEVMPAERAQ